MFKTSLQTLSFEAGQRQDREICQVRPYLRRFFSKNELPIRPVRVSGLDFDKPCRSILTFGFWRSCVERDKTVEGNP